MSGLVDSCMPVVEYGGTGLGKTVDVIAACGAGGFILTPKPANVASAETTLGIDVQSYFKTLHCTSLEALVKWLKKNAAVLRADAAKREAGYVNVVLDDLGVMARKSKNVAIAGPGMGPNGTDGPFVLTKSGGDQVLDTRAAYGYLGNKVQELCDVIEEESAAGLQFFVTSHEAEIKTDSKPGQPVVITSKPRSLGPELASVPQIDTFMKAMKIGVRVLPDTKSPLPWKGSLNCDRWDPYYIMKDSLNVFQKRGPQNLAEHFRKAGRICPRFAEVDWMEGWVATAAQMLCDGSNIKDIEAWASQPGVAANHVQWIVRDAYARAVLAGANVK